MAGGTNASNAFGWSGGAPIGGSKPAGEAPMPVLRSQASGSPLPQGVVIHVTPDGHVHLGTGPGAITAMPQGPHGMATPPVTIDDGPGTAAGDAARNAASAGAGGKKPPATTSTHSGGPPPPGIDQGVWDAMHQGFDDTIAGIHQSHDAAMAHIDQLAASGNASAIKYEQDLQARDLGLGRFAHANAAGINAGIAGEYRGATAQDRGFQAGLDHDMRSRGVGGADAIGLHDELGGALAALRASGAMYSSDSKAQQGLLQQMLNDREAEGATLKQGTMNDLVIAGNNAKYAADQQATADEAKARAAYNAGIISFKEMQSRNAATVQAAQIRASAKGTKAPPYSVYNKATGGTDYTGAFNNVFNHTDAATYPHEAALAGPIFSSLSNGTLAPLDALRVWLSKPQNVRDQNPGIEPAIRQAIADDQRNQRNQRAARRYGSTYYGS